MTKITLKESDNDWDDAFAELQAEAGGGFELRVIGNAEFVELGIAQRTGNASARAMLEAVMTMVDRAGAAEQAGQPLVCTTCDRPLQIGRFTVSLVMPMVPRPSRIMTFGICRYCAHNHAQAQEKTMQAARSVWPDMRIVTHPEGGHA